VSLQLLSVHVRELGAVWRAQQERKTLSTSRRKCISTHGSWEEGGGPTVTTPPRSPHPPLLPGFLPSPAAHCARALL
jgi:hypothetical protein